MEVGTLSARLPDALRLTWGVGLPGAVLAGAGLLWEGGVNRTIADSLSSPSELDS